MRFLFLCWAMCAIHAQEQLFTAKEIQEVDQLIERLISHGLIDTQQAKVYWQRLDEPEHLTIRDSQFGGAPTLQLPDGTFLSQGMWRAPKGSHLESNGQAIRKHFLYDNMTVIGDDGVTETPGLIFDLKEKLSEETWGTLEKKILSISGKDLPNDMNQSGHDHLGFLIGSLWRAGVPEGQELLWIAMLRMSVEHYDTWNDQKMPLHLGRTDLDKFSWNLGGQRSAAVPLLKPVDALKALYIRSCLWALTHNRNLTERDRSLDEDGYNKFLSKQVYTDILNDLSPQIVEHKDSLAVSVQKEPEGSVQERLRGWVQFWPDTRKPMNFGGLSIGLHDRSYRLPPIYTEKSYEAVTRGWAKIPKVSAPRFSDKDVPELMSLVGNHSPSAWIEHGIARSIGDNALRALTGLFGGDPRLLIAYDPTTPWNDQARNECALQLQKYWQNLGDNPIMKARAQMISRAPLIDVVWMLDARSVKEKQDILTLATQEWGDTEPEWFKDGSNTFNFDKTLTHFLYLCRAVEPFAKVIDTWNWNTLRGNSLPMWHYSRDKKEEVLAFARLTVQGKSNESGYSMSNDLLLLLADRGMIKELVESIPVSLQKHKDTFHPHRFLNLFMAGVYRFHKEENYILLPAMNFDIRKRQETLRLFIMRQLFSCTLLPNESLHENLDYIVEGKNKKDLTIGHLATYAAVQYVKQVQLSDELKKVLPHMKDHRSTAWKDNLPLFSKALDQWLEERCKAVKF